MDLFQRLERERLADERVGQASSPAGSSGVPPGIPTPVAPPKPSQAEALKTDQPKPESPKAEAK